MPKHKDEDSDFESETSDIDKQDDDFDDLKSEKSDDIEPEKETGDVKEDEPDEPMEEQSGEPETQEVNIETEEAQTCIYKIDRKTQKEKLKNELENIDEDSFDDEKKSSKIVPPETRITKPILTKYERVRILGDRIKQLTLGAKPMLKNTEDLSPKEIAKLELQHHVIPFIVVRTLPSGLIEHWKISELQIIN